MNRISDSAIERLRATAAEPEFDHPRYELREPLGSGGMGAVYRALDCELDREVAIKIMHPVDADHPGESEAASRTRREAQIIARLEHPGIVPVHDVGRLSDGRVYYVMKLVRGARLDQSPVMQAALTERLRVFERLCETIAFAHAHGVLHRDLKPQNVMIGSFGEVLVLDWGIARWHGAPEPEVQPDSPPSEAPVADTATRRTAAGVVMGTPAYMSPEQARGELDRVDERSDVFGLGAILHYLLTSAAPRQASGAAAAASPRQRDRRIAKRLDAICGKALRPEPAGRYATAGELAADIARFRDGQRVLAYREPWWERLARWCRRYSLPLLLVLAYLLMRGVLEIFWPSEI